MTTGRINQGASCVRSLAWSDTRPLSVDERAAPALAPVESPCVSLLPPVSQAGRRHSVCINIACALERDAASREYSEEHLA